MNPCDILIKPIITEESMKNMQDRKYTFQVAVSANKIEIANCQLKVVILKHHTVL